MRHVLVTGREATRRLQAIGVSERSARRVLAAGLAGDPVVTPAAHLYDADTVDRLAARPHLSWPELREACPHGLFVARRAGDVEDLAGDWPISPWVTSWMSILVDRHGSVPLVGAVAGFVTVGADIVRVGFAPGWTSLHPLVRLTLAPAGAWFERFRERQLITGPGPTWVLLNVAGRDAPGA